MIKICHFTSVHSSNDVRIFHKECSSLAREGYLVYLVTPGSSYELNGVHVIGVGEKPKSRVTRMFSFSKQVYEKALELDADVYHFHDPELLPYGAKLKKRGKIVIYDAHENYSLTILFKAQLKFRKTIAFFFHMYEQHVVKSLDAAIIPCTYNGKNIFENIAKRTVYIDNLPLINELYSAYNPNRTDKYICYIGGLSYYRGITHLIKAAYESKVKLVLGGKFGDPQYFKYVKALKEYECVEYVGYVDRTEIAEIFNRASIGVCIIMDEGQNSQADNFPTKVYEYMAMGLPVLLTDQPRARKFVEAYPCGICVKPNEVGEISSAINYLLANPNIAENMGNIGREAVLEKYNWYAEENKLIKLYKELLEDELQ